MSGAEQAAAVGVGSDGVDCSATARRRWEGEFCSPGARFCDGSVAAACAADGSGPDDAEVDCAGLDPNREVMLNVFSGALKFSACV